MKLLFVLLALSSFSAFAEEAMIVRFELTPSIKTLLRSNEFDITGVNLNTNTIEALLTQEELDLIKSYKTTVTYSFPKNLALAPDERYKNPEEIEEFVKDIHGRFPEITELKIIGKSLEGRDMYAIKISDNAQTSEQEPAILFNGMHHAREVMTPEITTDLIEYLVTNYRSDADVTRWVDNNEIWVIPMLNVDGNNRMWTRDSMWRKNARGEYGVDINRNYPTGWGSCNGSSSRQRAQDYRGEGPASEPETQNMMAFVSAIKPVFNISYHSYSEIVIYPFGCRPLRTPTGQSVEVIGKEIATKIGYKAGTAWELLYNADGGDIDWMYTEQQVIPFVVEVNSDAAGFHPSYDKWRDKTVLQNRPGWMHLLNRLEGPSLQGVAPSDYKNISIKSSGSSAELQNYRINPNGTFYVILERGEYDVSFTGNKTKSLTKLQVDGKKVINF